MEQSYESHQIWLHSKLFLKHTYLNCHLSETKATNFKLCGAHQLVLDTIFALYKLLFISISRVAEVLIKYRMSTVIDISVLGVRVS